MKWNLHTLLLLMAVLLAGLHSRAQQPVPNTDAVLDVQEQSSSVPQSNIYDLINRANAIMIDKPVEATDMIREALEQAYEQKDERAMAYCYNSLGGLSYQLKRYSVAIENYQKAIELFLKLDEKKGLRNSYKYIATAYDAQASYDKSIDYYKKYANLSANVGDSSAIVETWNNLGRIHYNLEAFPQAGEYYSKALQYYKYHNNEDGIVEANNNLGLVELAENKVNTALERFNESQEMAQRTGNRRGEANSYSNMSQAYEKKKDKKKQIEYEQQALNTNTSYNNPDLAYDNNWNLAQTYMADNNAPEAIPFLHNTINLSKELGTIEESEGAFRALGELYEQQGDFDKALETYREYMRLVDSLKQAELNRDIASIRLSSELSKSEERIQLLENQRLINAQEIEIMRSDAQAAKYNQSRQQIIIWSLAGGLGIMALAGFLVYRSSQQKRKANQLLALQSLRSQMNPHFIFNALNSVNSFISMNDERSANKYLSDFSRLMRSVMENSKHDFVSLRSELEILKLYTRLEHFRFSDKFDYTFEVDDEIQEDMIEVPPMLIQPYIENAVWHGLRYTDEKGHLWIKFLQRKDHLLVTIEDNGIGRDQSAEIKTRNQKSNKSTGMSNIKQRLNIINEIHGTNLRVEVTDRNPEASNKGTCVKIKIPFNQTEA